MKKPNIDIFKCGNCEHGIVVRIISVLHFGGLNTSVVKCDECLKRYSYKTVNKLKHIKTFV